MNQDINGGQQPGQPTGRSESASNVSNTKDTVKYVLSVVLNSLIFAIVFAPALLYFRTKPEKLHQAIRTFFLRIDHAAAGTWFDQFDLVSLMTKVILIFVLAPVVYVLSNVFQPKIAHLQKKSRRAAFPIWMCAIIGLIFVAIVDMTTEIASPSGTLSEWLSASIGSSLLVRAYFWSTTKVDSIEPKKCVPKKTIAETKSETTTNDQDDDETSQQDNERFDEKVILAWLESDDPTEYDLLGTRLAEKSQQLRDLIVQRKPSQRIQSIGIVGRFGAGKSSMVNFLQKELIKPENKDQFIFCQVSTWRFDESATAIQHILTEILREIEKELDTFRVRKLPDTFRKGFSSFGGELIDKLSDMLFGDESLESRLQKLDGILCRAGKTMILVVEDLDRNDDTKFDSGQVQAFLHLLKPYSSIVTIISGEGIVSDRHKIDFVKLTEIIVEIGLPSFEKTTLMIKSIKSMCERRLPPEYKSTLRQRHEGYWDFQEFLDTYSKRSGLVNAIINLLGSPRNLKHVLRRTLRIMDQSLNGEVDWDHLFLANVVRQVDVRVLRYVDMFHSELSRRNLTSAAQDSISQHLDSPGSNPEDKPLHSEWNRIIKDLPYKEDLEVVMGFLVFAFPAKTPVRNYGSSDWPPEKPQGAKSKRHWRRILHESISEKESKDKDLILDYAGYAEGESCNFVKNCSKFQSYADGWSVFHEELEPDNFSIASRLLVDITNECCALSLNNEPSAPFAMEIAAERFAANFIAELHDSMPESQIDEAFLVLEKLIQETAKSNLRCCVILRDLVIRFSKYDHDKFFHLFHRIPTYIRVAALQGVGFSQLLRKADSNVLYDLIIGWKHEDPSISWSIVFEDWQWITPDMLISLENNEKHVKDALIQLLTHSNKIRLLDAKIGKSIFASEYYRIQNWL